MPLPACVIVPEPEMLPAKVGVSLRSKTSALLSVTGADDAAAGAAGADLQRAGADGGAAGVGVRAGQDQRAAADLGDPAGRK